MWRYFETMPVLDEANIVSLGEGMTPILEAPRLAEAISATNVVIKDEGQNPTGTFKSRGLSAAVSKAKELGAEGRDHPHRRKRGRRAGRLRRKGRPGRPRLHAPGRPRRQQEGGHPRRRHAPSRRWADRRGRTAVPRACRRAWHVRPLDPPGAVPRGGQEDHGLRDSRAVRLDVPRRDHLPHRRRHWRRRNLEGDRGA